MWLSWTVALGLAQAETAPLTIGGGAGPTVWLGDVPGEYVRSLVGSGFSVEVGVPVKNGWTTGGGVAVSLFSVGVPYALRSGSRHKDMRFDIVTAHVDVGRSWSMGERTHVRLRGGPAFVSMVVGTDGGATVLDCVDDECVQRGVYNTNDDRVVVDEVQKESPFGWSPGALVATGVQWQAVEGEQGLVLSVDLFAAGSGRHPRSGLSGTHMGVWLGVALGGPRAGSMAPPR